MNLVAGRQGHFRLESGHHSTLWLDLDALFVDPARLKPLVDQLAHALRRHSCTAVCGPLTGGAFLAQMLAAELGVEFAFTERVLPPDRAGLYAVQYLLPAGLRDRVRGKRFAVVDDVISAGSAVRGTCADLEAHGGAVAVVGALLGLGSKAPDFFAARGTPMVFVDQLPYDMWLASECPLCREGVVLEDVAVAKGR